MEWVNAAETFLGHYGWGARGQNLGISRMFNESDKISLTRSNIAIALRPRGILSGFLVIMPGGDAVYIPPIAAKVPPQRLRLRTSDTVSAHGAVFSAYLTRDTSKRLVIEDVLVWKAESVWHTRRFSERWNTIMDEFVSQHFRSDHVLQGCEIELATYYVPASFKEPSEKMVVECIPDNKGTKRLIYMPRAVLPPVSHTVPSIHSNYTVRKEAGMGPDVYAVYRDEERLGLALVRTLAVSKALRLAVGSSSGSIGVRAEHNKTFDKYEIREVLQSV